VANGRGRRSFQCLEANGRKRRSLFSPFSTSHPSNLLGPSSFSFDLTVLLYYNFRPLFTHSLFLSLAYKLWCAFRCHKSPTHLLSIQFGWRFFFYTWDYGVTHGHVLCLKLCKQMKSRPQNHLYIWRWHNILMMKTLHRERCAPVLKLIPLELNTITFLRILAPWYFVVSRPCFWWWT